MIDKRYTVYLRKTDELICCHGTSVQCAAAMKLASTDCFFTIKAKTKSGKIKKWKIYEDDENGEE